MTPELTVLSLAGLLQAIQFVAFSVAANMQVGVRVAAGTRDQPVHLTGTAGRLQRALTNHFEGLVLFTLAVVVVTLSDQSSDITTGCAWLYLAARVVYVPAYVLGWAPWRSLIWAVGFLSTLTMIISALM